MQKSQLNFNIAYYRIVFVLIKLHIDFSFTFYQLYDRLMPMIKQKYKISDDVLYSKCLEYDECNITAEQLGASDDYSIPLHAPVSLQNINL